MVRPMASSASQRRLRQGGLLSLRPLRVSAAIDHLGREKPHGTQRESLNRKAGKFGNASAAFHHPRYFSGFEQMVGMFGEGERFSSSVLIRVHPWFAPPRSDSATRHEAASCSLPLSPVSHSFSVRDCSPAERVGDTIRVPVPLRPFSPVVRKRRPPLVVHPHHPRNPR